MLKFILSLLIFVDVISLKASTITAIAVGNWNSSTTWDNTIPGCYDTIIIPAGITVTITSSVNLNACPSTFIWVKGELHFQTGKKLDLSCGSAVYLDAGLPAGKLTKGSGGGSSNYLKICNVTYWQAADGDVTGPAIFCAGCSLPIELLDFSAVAKSTVVEVNWITASERNNSHFILERSANGHDWEELILMDGAGNSTMELSYSYIDQNPYAGISYYRLSQVDFDGQNEVFDPVSVEMITNAVFVYPNPVQNGGIITIQTSTENPVLQIFDTLGKVCGTTQLTMVSTEAAKVTYQCDLPAGVYMLIIYDQLCKLIVFN